MHHIPAGTAHITTASSGSVVAEPVDHAIPHRLEVVDQESFRKSDPHGHNHQKTTAKFTQG